MWTDGNEVTIELLQIFSNTIVSQSSSGTNEDAWPSFLPGLV